MMCWKGRIILLILTLLGGNIMAQNIRPATVAGKFYDADRESLIRTVARCYKKAETMAPLSREERDGRTTVQAVVVPMRDMCSRVLWPRQLTCGSTRKCDISGFFFLVLRIMWLLTVRRWHRHTRLTVRLWVMLMSILLHVWLCNRRVRFGYVPAAHDREHCLEVQLPLFNTV